MIEEAREWSLGNLITVIAATLGNIESASSLVLYSIGVFISRLHSDRGRSRTDIAVSATLFTIVVFAGTPLVGRLADRMQPARLAAGSLLSVGICLIVIPRHIHTVGSLWAMYFGVAVIGLGTSPVVVNSPVAANFSRSRGLAIGVAIAGLGLGAFVAPRLAAVIMEKLGWVAGYSALGVFALVVAPIVWFFLGSARRGVDTVPGKTSFHAPGEALRTAFRLPAFWVLSLISILVGFGMSGPVAHMVPVLRDHNLSTLEAANLASLLGFSNVAGRLVTGYSLDRAGGPLPGLPFLGIGAIALIILIVSGVADARLAVLMLGFAVGAEFDLVAYFTSRYFGLRAYASIFGWQYGMVAFGAAFAPALLGLLRDRLGDYTVGLALSSACLGTAALLCPLLGRYRFAP